MAVKALSVEDIVSKFPIKALPPINGEPTYSGINDMMQALYANAATMQTTLGGGRHGHIGMIMKPALYATLSQVAYEKPEDPGPLPVYGRTASDQVRQNVDNEFHENKRVYENHYNTDLALKALIIEAVDKVYLDEKYDRYTGFLTVSSRDLMDHLLNRYGKILPSDIMENKRRMDEPLDADLPIDMYFKRIDECVQFATDAGNPFTPSQILQTAYYAIASCGLYTDACKLWRKRPKEEKTWTEFKQYFADEYHDLKEMHKTSAKETGFHAANLASEEEPEAADDFMEAFQNLAMAATTDKTTIAQLVEANAKLVESNKILTEQLAMIQQQVGNKAHVPTNTFVARKAKQDWTMDPKGYCWTHGYRVKVGHNSYTCSNKKEGHKDEATRANILGGSTQNKNWVHPGLEVNNSGNNSNTGLQHYCSNNLVNNITTTPMTSAILDSGASSHYIAENHAHILQNVRKDTSVNVNLPNGNTLASTLIGTLSMLGKPSHKASQAHVIQGLNKSLLSIGKICDANYTAVFDKTSVKICKQSLHVPEETIVVRGQRNPTNGLWTTPLQQKQHELCKIDHYKNATTQNMILFLYYAAFSPAVSTLIKAINKGFFQSWPGFTSTAVRTYVKNLEATSKGHLDHVRKNIRSTKDSANTAVHDLRPQDNSTPIARVQNKPHLNDCMETPQQEPDNVETKDFFVRITDIHRVYTDQTGKFPVKSSRGSQYCFVIYSYDANAIIVYPIKNRNAVELLEAYKKGITYLTMRGFKPNMHFLDNEASSLLKMYNRNKNISFQLAPPHSHRRNAAERAIRTWKNHFISGLCTVHPKFPMHLWDRLIQQSVITLNLLRSCRRNPAISAYAALEGNFNYDATPLAPPGCKTVIYEPPSQRRTFAPHGIDGWYIGPAVTHYRCYTVYVPKTRGERISDSVTFHPHLCDTPNVTPLERIVIAAKDLTSALTNQHHDLPMLSSRDNDDTMAALQKLAEIFRTKYKNSKIKLPKRDTVRPPRVHMHQKQVTVDAAPSRVHASLAPTPFPVRAPHVIPPDTIIHEQISPVHANKSTSTTTNRPHLYNTRHSVKIHGACAVIDPVNGKSLEYRHLIKHPVYKHIWNNSMSNEIGRLAQGNKNVKGTDTMFFIEYNDIPFDRRKDITYARIVVDYRPQKTEKERTRITVGGNLINYPDNVSTKTAEITTAKILFNSVISSPQARFGVLDIGNFYLGTPMLRYEYMFINISDIPDDIVQKYNLKAIAKNGKVYVEIRKGMYGLPQAGILANELLQKNLFKHGYAPCKHTPGLWTHKTRPIQFVLVVDDFGVKYEGKEHFLHLISAIKEFYPKISIDWQGKLFCGIKLQWNYTERYVDLSMPGYIKDVLHKFQHPTPKFKQYAPYPFQRIIYGQNTQTPTPIDKSPLLNDKEKKYIQQVIGALLYYARAIDCTMLVTLSKIAHMQAAPTQFTKKLITHLLDYCATNPDATIRYHPCDMILKVHSDASYLSEPKARSRCGGHFYLGKQPVRLYTPNGPLLNTTNVIHTVVTSAAEAEYAALYMNAKTATPLRHALIEMGHKQPPTPIQSDNTTAVGLANDTIKQRFSKALDMRWYWIKDQIKLRNFDVFFRPGSENKGDYFTKNHSPTHHRQIRYTYLHQSS